MIVACDDINLRPNQDGTFLMLLPLAVLSGDHPSKHWTWTMLPNQIYFNNSVITSLLFYFMLRSEATIIYSQKQPYSLFMEVEIWPWRRQQVLKCWQTLLPQWIWHLSKRSTKIRICLTLIRPVVAYASETWTLTDKDEMRLHFRKTKDIWSNTNWKRHMENKK